MAVDKFKVTASGSVAGGQFGASAAVSEDTAIVGAPFGNAAYVFVPAEESGPSRLSSRRTTGPEANSGTLSPFMATAWS